MAELLTNQRRNIMKNLINNMQRFMQDEEGVTAIEYGLIAALIAVGIIGTVGATGTAVSGTFGTVAAAL
jgi:pilus assembly protein Flp/PilA